MTAHGERRDAAFLVASHAALLKYWRYVIRIRHFSDLRGFGAKIDCVAITREWGRRNVLIGDDRIQGILNKYCKFMPVQIIHGTNTEMVDDPSGEKDEEGNVKKTEKVSPRIVNEATPLWSKAPADLKDEDYKKFYQDLYPMNFEEPLFHIHLNVDFPFNLTGILYFPQLKKEMELRRDKIHLYSNQVFITDNVEGIVPDFLQMLKGVIDSPDIPLNVSRSYLQADGAVKKISGYITWIIYILQHTNNYYFVLEREYYRWQIYLSYILTGSAVLLITISLFNLGKSTRLGLPKTDTTLKIKGLYRISRNNR